MTRTDRLRLVVLAAWPKGLVGWLLPLAFLLLVGLDYVTVPASAPAETFQMEFLPADPAPAPERTSP